jgi:hypothetical protein
MPLCARTAQLDYSSSAPGPLARSDPAAISTSLSTTIRKRASWLCTRRGSGPGSPPRSLLHGPPRQSGRCRARGSAFWARPCPEHRRFQEARSDHASPKYSEPECEYPGARRASSEDRSDRRARRRSPRSSAGQPKMLDSPSAPTGPVWSSSSDRWRQWQTPRHGFLRRRPLMER